MLSQQCLELLTAYVDGELTPQQRSAVKRLLAQSPEARALLEKLQSDSGRLRRLPRVPAPARLASAVQAAVARGRPRPGRRRPEPQPATLPLWLGIAAAAAVVFVVGVGSFLYHADPGDGSDPDSIVITRPHTDEDRLPPPRRDEYVKSTPHPTPPSVSVPPEQEDPQPARPDEKKGPIDRLPPSRPPELERPDDRVLTSPDKGSAIAFERVEVALPIIHRVHDLDQPGRFEALRAHLGSGGAFRVEVLCRDATRGFEHLRAALAARRFTFHTDPSAQNLLGKPQWKADYAVFLENLTPVLLAEILRDAGALDRNAARKRPSDQRFEGALVVKVFARADQRELADLIGLDPVKVRPTTVAAPVPRMALVLNFNAARPRRVHEVKRFLSARRALRPDTVQVLLILRHLPG